MKNHLLVLVLIAVTATLFGIGVSVKLTNDPVLTRVVGQQQEILVLQKKIDQQLSGTGSAGTVGAQQDKIQLLENRIAQLEKKIEALAAAPKLPTAPQQFGPPPEDYTTVHDLPIGNSPVKGNRKAPITITGFLDLQCPFSARFQPVIDQVLAAYPDKVNYVIKEYPLPFHPQAKPAAKAVLAAGEQGKYWDMVTLILKDNKDLSDPKLREFAQAIKLDMKKFEADLKKNDAQWEQQIMDEFELGDQAGVPGTPTYYINGRKTVARDMASFKKEIDELLNKK